MLENFANEETVKFSERVLHDLGKQKAKLEMAVSIFLYSKIVRNFLRETFLLLLFCNFMGSHYISK